MAVKFSNNAVTTLSASISLGAGSDWTYVTINSEVIKITAISGTTFTCKATTGAHTSSSSVELRMSAELLNDVALGDDESLDAIVNASTITGNAVDIFIYDTSKDSDGGAWRKRTQDTSWYNETASSTRGSRKDFPAVAVIVVTATTVTIYDGDTPDLDMWMVFNQNVTWQASYLGRTQANPTSVAMLNGKLSVTRGNVGYGEALLTVDFISEEAFNISPGNNLRFLSSIVGRDNNIGVGSSPFSIVNNAVNDVAMTVLPNAPIDSTTGLPTPTIAVATDGGVSVIKDDGTVVSRAENNATMKSSFIHFTGNGSEYYYVHGWGGNAHDTRFVMVDSGHLNETVIVQVIVIES